MSIEKESEPTTVPENYCSETDTEVNGYHSNSGSDAFCSPKASYRSKTVCAEEELDEDAPLMSLFQSVKSSSKNKTGRIKGPSNSTEQSPETLPNLTSNHQRAASRKRVRVILSDDDDSDNDEMQCSNRKGHDHLSQDFATSDASEFDF